MKNRKYLSKRQQIQEKHIKHQKLQFSMNGLDVDVMWVACVPNDHVWKYEKHKDTGFEIHLISEGQCTITIEDELPQIVSAGQLFIIPPGVYHAQQSDPKNPAKEYGLNMILSINESQFDTDHEEAHFIQLLQREKNVLVVDDLFQIAEAFETLFQEDEQKLFGYRSHTQALIYTIIINSVRSVAITMGEKTIDIKPDINEQRMEKINQVINEHLDQNLTLKEVSNLLYLSERQINRVVLNVHNQTFRQYLLNLKLQKARVWLTDTSLQVQEVAEQLGFYDSYHFSQAFKNKHGFLPSDIRKILNDK